MSWVDRWLDVWPIFLAVVAFALSVLCSVHAILFKRDSRAAMGWVGLVWLSPVLGGILYFLFGINRVRRFARANRSVGGRPVEQSMHACTATELPSALRSATHLLPLAHLGERTTGRPLLSGNRITPLVDGDEAYPEMLDAIGKAERSISLSSYIFDNDRVGRRFVDALAAAHRRGVTVRVLVDDVGVRYSADPITRALSRNDVPVARFLGALRPLTLPHINLRKHRKLLVTDGRCAFTGGMNIREGHQHSLSPKHPVADVHFRVEGPLVAQLQSAFADDWFFTRREALDGPDWFPPLERTGDSLARAVTDGPDEDLGKLPLLLHGAVTAARDSVHVVTPYFLPETPLLHALFVAARRGVRVVVLLPEANNLPFVQWATNPLLPELLAHGVEVRFSPPPFDHTKLLVVDRAWTLFGSANWDPRSLRLNFELNVEVFDETFGARMLALVERKLASSRRLTADALAGRRFPVRLRDGVARLFAPYL